MSRQSFAAPAAAVLVCIVAAFCFKSCQPVPVEFESIRAAEKALKSAGFFCVPLDHHKAMVISEIPITEEEAVQIQIKHAIIQRPGLAFATAFRYHYDLDSPSLRTWGKIAVTGDPETLDKIENVIKRP